MCSCGGWLMCDNCIEYLNTMWHEFHDEDEDVCTFPDASCQCEACLDDYKPDYIIEKE